MIKKLALIAATLGLAGAAFAQHTVPASAVLNISAYYAIGTSGDLNVPDPGDGGFTHPAYFSDVTNWTGTSNAQFHITFTPSLTLPADMTNGAGGNAVWSIGLVNVGPFGLFGPGVVSSGGGNDLQVVLTPSSTPHWIPAGDNNASLGSVILMIGG